ncbi:tetratricopeptide repeat protein [Singulisphaera rosea]
MGIKALVFICALGLGIGCDRSNNVGPSPVSPSTPGNTHQQEGEFASKDAFSYAGRAQDFLVEGKYDQALQQYDRALELRPDESTFRNSRGFTWHMKGIQDNDRPACEDRALADYAEAIRLAPNRASAINNRAWLYATSKVDRCRNGKLAVEEATKACELTGWNNPGYVDTLSCAYAEIGDFEQAIRWQRKALEDPTYRQDEGDNANVKLTLYGDKKPFWE